MDLAVSLYVEGFGVVSWTFPAMFQTQIPHVLLMRVPFFVVLIEFDSCSH